MVTLLLNLVEYFALELSINYTEKIKKLNKKI